eukprot:11209045-Lingulodinium_polyedra.AAC.1
MRHANGLPGCHEGLRRTGVRIDARVDGVLGGAFVIVLAPASNQARRLKSEVGAPPHRHSLVRVAKRGDI